MKDTRLEEYVVTRLREIYPTARRTPGSGSILDDADGRTPYWVVECKGTGRTNNINILHKHIVKVREQAYRRGKEWLTIHSTPSHNIVSLDLEVFLEVLKGEYPSGGRKTQLSEESSSSDKQEVWSREDYNRFTSGGEGSHRNSKS